MTLEERLLKRLQNWRAAAKQHREAMDELDGRNEEWWMHKVEAEVFERVVSELAVDLSARSTASAPRPPRRVQRNGDNLTVRARTRPVVG